MINLHRKFIFIHIHKVAGKSISRALEKNIFPSIINSNDFLHYHYKKRFMPSSIVYENESISKHSKAIDYKSYLSNDYENYFKFAFVRNPFDWQVSLFHYMKQHKEHFQHEIVKNMNFVNYIEWRCSQDLNYQSDYILDHKDNIIVDFIGKFENINVDLKKIEDILDFKLKIPHINKSNHSHYSSYYDKHTKNLIIKNFEKDFNLLNYSYNF